MLLAPYILQVIVNEPEPAKQQYPNGIETSTPKGQDLTAGSWVLVIDTAADYGGAHKGRTCTDTQGNTYDLLQDCIGLAPYDGGNINTSQETALWLAKNVKGGPNTWTTKFIDGDNDYPACIVIELAGNLQFVGSDSNIQDGGKGLPGVHAGQNNLTSKGHGGIPVLPSQTPGIAIGFCVNVSNLGQPPCPTPGDRMVLLQNVWPFDVGTDTGCLATQQFKDPAPNYETYFNAVSNGPDHYQTLAAIFALPDAATVAVDLTPNQIEQINAGGSVIITMTQQQIASLALGLPLVLSGGSQTQAATPVASPGAGSYGSSQSVTLSCSTTGSTIYYTTDGSTPTTSSTPYTGAITVASTLTLKAIATAPGYLPSAVLSAAYTIAGASQCATPTITPNGGSFGSPQTVTLACSTAGSTTYYSTDNVHFTAGSSLTVSSSETVYAYATATGYTQSNTASAAFTISGGALAAPSNVGILYQGQTGPNESVEDGQWFTPANANTLTIQWNTVTGAASYKIYRSVNGGAASFLASVTAGGGATQTYVDNTATGCVGVQPAPPPQFAAATSYAYYLSTVNSGGTEGAQSTQFSWYFYETDSGSLPLRCLYQELTNGVTVTYGGTIGSSGPCIAVTLTEQYGEWLCALGNNGVNWNLWSGAFNYLTFDLYDSVGGTTFNIVPHVRTVGGDTLDTLFTESGGNLIYNVTGGAAGTWTTYKIPLSVIHQDYRNGTGTNGSYSGGSSYVNQASVYKMDFQPTGPGAGYQFGVRNYGLTVV